MCVIARAVPSVDVCKLTPRVHIQKYKKKYNIDIISVARWRDAKVPLEDLYVGHAVQVLSTGPDDMLTAVSSRLMTLDRNTWRSEDVLVLAALCWSRRYVNSRVIKSRLYGIMALDTRHKYSQFSFRLPRECLVAPQLERSVLGVAYVETILCGLSTVWHGVNR